MRIPPLMHFAACLAIGCEASIDDLSTPVLPTANEAKQANSAVPATHSDERPWRADRALSGRFHPESPDDIQVVVHDGGPRMTDVPQELMWVRIMGQEGAAYRGELLNTPDGLRSVSLGDSILFMPGNAGNLPFRVTEKYLEERPNWHIKPCRKCGMPELFDAPSELMARIFPDSPPRPGLDVEGTMFTSFCPMCGEGMQLVSDRPIE